MSVQGHIRRWDAEKGFGFIESAPGNSVFFHIRDYRAATPPQVGQPVSFEEIHVGGKGLRAMEVRPTGPTLQGARGSRGVPQRAPTAAPRERPQRSREGRLQPARHREEVSPSGAALAYLLMLYWLCLVVWAVLQQRLPLAALGGLCLLNLLTFGFYAWDKNAARKGQWRTPEQHLHLLALAGGWPAAWWAQQWLRHKSRKATFRTMYWVTVLLHCGALSGLLLHPQGQTLLRSLFNSMP
jgi:uncharacterized membrane protein YsdA (DUF1294 family)/cold shock CspA family protein